MKSMFRSSASVKNLSQAAMIPTICLKMSNAKLGVSFSLSTGNEAGFERTRTKA